MCTTAISAEKASFSRFLSISRPLFQPAASNNGDQFKFFFSLPPFRYIETFLVLFCSHLPYAPLSLFLVSFIHSLVRLLVISSSSYIASTVSESTQLIDLYLTQKRQTNFSQLLLLNAYKLKNKEVK